MKFLTRKRILPAILLGILVLGGSYAVFRILLSTGNIMDGAELVCECPDSVSDYAWLTEDEILLRHRSDGGKKSTLGRQAMGGKETPIQLPKIASDGLRDLFSLRNALSPDGKRLMWSLGGSILTCGLDGLDLKSIRTHTGRYTYVMWEPDSTGWFQIDSRGGERPRDILIRRQAGTNAVTAETPIDLEPPSPTAPYIIPSHITGNGALIGFWQDGEFRGVKDVDFCVIPLSASPSRYQSYKVKPPPNAVFLFGLSLAPMGDRIIMSVLANDPPPFLDHLLFRLFHKPISRRRYTAQYVCNIDGSGLREIGRQPLGPDDAPFTELQWSPSGKRISWVWRSRIWRIPA